MKEFDYGREISIETLHKWQKITNLIATIVDVPIGCLTRLVGEDFSLFVNSENAENPFEVGHIGCLDGSRLYCERTLNDNKMLLVGNALEDSYWDVNPEVEMGLISYLGFPVHWPDGEIFGTFCVLDTKENFYSNLIQELMESLLEVIRADLELIYMNTILGEDYTCLHDYLDELKAIRVKAK